MEEYIFETKLLEISDTATIIILDYDDCDLLYNLIDKYFVKICEGDSGSDLRSVKLQLKGYLKNKKNFQRIGAVAEFFAHLYFINNNFKQECLFFNLEENSPKKGFDGVYTKDKELWIMESKARNAAKGVTHKANLKIAYNDLNDKFKGVVKRGQVNNPWKNAYNHACNINVKTQENIRKTIKQISDDYINQKFSDASQYNIIPCSTIICEAKMDDLSKENLINKIKVLLSEFNYQKVILFAISSRIYNSFIKYLEV